jgi:hypothetical protein
MNALIAFAVLVSTIYFSSVSFADITDAQIGDKVYEVRSKCQKDLKEKNAPLEAKSRAEMIKILGPGNEMKPPNAEQRLKIDEIQKQKKIEGKPAADAYAICMKKVDQLYMLMDKKPGERKWPEGI